VRTVGAEQGLGAALLDDPVQIVDDHTRLAHHRHGSSVVAAHVLLEAVEVAAALRMPLVEDRRGQGEDDHRAGLLPQTADDLFQVGLVGIEIDLKALAVLGALEVVQPAIEMHQGGVFLDHPLVEVFEHVGAVAAVGLRADDHRLPGEMLLHEWGVPHADRVTDEYHAGQLRLRIGGGLRCGRQRRPKDRTHDQEEHASIHWSSPLRD
jgi:hypothetical protein